MYKCKNTKGYSLVEVLVAVSILLIATVGPMTIATKSLQTARYATEKSVATFMAQEGIEAVVALRNESIITAVQALDLSQSWDWTDAPDMNRCFNATGCNIGFHASDPGNNIIDCSTQSNCTMVYREGWQVPFAEVPSTHSSPEYTKYMRVIRLEETVPDTEVQITSTVYWDSPVIGGSGLESVEVQGAVFNIYE